MDQVLTEKDMLRLLDDVYDNGGDPACVVTVDGMFRRKDDGSMEYIPWEQLGDLGR